MLDALCEEPSKLPIEKVAPGVFGNESRASMQCTLNHAAAEPALLC